MTRVELPSKANVSINTLGPLFNDTWKGIRSGWSERVRYSIYQRSRTY